MWLPLTLAIGVLASNPTPAADLPAAVHLRLDQSGGLTRSDLSEVAAQVRMIWAPAHVGVTEGDVRDRAPDGAVVLSLRVVGEEPPARPDRPVLAWTPLAPGGTIAPLLFVSRPAITRLTSAADFRGRPLSQRPALLLRRLINQAIGRAAAHELGHFLLQAGGHADRGLMRPTYTIDDLLGSSLERFAIRAADRRAFHDAVASLAERQRAARGSS